MQIANSGSATPSPDVDSSTKQVAALITGQGTEQHLEGYPDRPHSLNFPVLLHQDDPNANILVAGIFETAFSEGVTRELVSYGLLAAR